MFALIREYAGALARTARWRLGYAAALMIGASMTEGLGLALMLPLLELAGVALGAHSEAGRFAAAVRGAFGALHMRPAPAPILALFVALVCVHVLLSFMQGAVITELYEDFARGLRGNLFEAISGADWSFICRNRSADLVHALTDEVDRAGAAACQGLYAVAGAALAALYIAASLLLFPAATLLMLALCAVLAVALRTRTRAVHRAGADFSGVAGAVYSAAIEHLQSLKTARMYGAQRRTCDIFARLTRELAATGVRMTREQLAADAWFEAGAAALLGAILLAALQWFAISPAEVLVLLVLFARLVPRVRATQSSYRSFVSLLPGYATVAALQRRCRAAAEPSASGPAPQLRTALRLEDVSFAYPADERPVVNNVNMAIPAGRIVAIAGPSGAGKSTIADLLMGLMAPASGRIVVDGVALDGGCALAWRDQIGYVAQDTFLFHDTVRANLRWARPGATEAELQTALRMAAADEFTARLPHGLDTVVGDRGCALSAGERQRLALARALLRRPRLLVLDEATNSLDSENEAKILGAIEQMHGGVTTVLIAHRLSTVRWADLIYVIENGAVVESGEWTALSSKIGSRLRNWCMAQGIAA